MEIRSIADLEAWGKTVSREQRILAKSRANLRSLPHVLPDFDLRAGYRVNEDPETAILRDLIEFFSSDYRIYASLKYEVDYGFGMALAPLRSQATYMLEGDKAEPYLREVEEDCSAIADLKTTLELFEYAERKLWHSFIPDSVNSAWDSIKKELNEISDSWDVWTQWYSQRMRRSFRYLPLEEAMHRLLADSDLSSESALYVNTELRKIVNLHDPALRSGSPEAQDVTQRTAILRAEWREGLVHRADTEPGIDDAEQAARLRAAWQALRDAVADLRLSHGGGNWPRLERALTRYAEALGEDFDALNVIAIGVHGEKITGLAESANEYLMSDAAEELSAIARAHGPFIAQLDEWRAYLDDAQPDPSEKELALARDVARALAAERGLIAPDVAEPLEILAEDAEPEAQPDPKDKRELVNGVRNTLAALFGYVGGKLKKLDEGVDDGVKAVGKLGMLVGASVLLAKLGALAAVPGGEFAWLIPWLGLLKQRLDK